MGFRCPAVSNHPPTELFDGLEVEIECLRADSRSTVSSFLRRSVRRSAKWIVVGLPKSLSTA